LKNPAEKLLADQVVVNADVCIMANLNGETAQISMFDPKTGVVKPALTIHGGILNESFSPDGTTLAVAPDYGGRIPAEIQLYNLRDASQSTLKVKGWRISYGMDWNPDGRSLWISARTSRGVGAIVSVDLQGNVTPLFEDTQKPSWLGDSFAGWQPPCVLEAEPELERVAVA
jgi:Tol biopolymer transport system component